MKKFNIKAAEDRNSESYKKKLVDSLSKRIKQVRSTTLQQRRGEHSKLDDLISSALSQQTDSYDNIDDLLFPNEMTSIENMNESSFSSDTLSGPTLSPMKHNIYYHNEIKYRQDTYEEFNESELIELLGLP